MYCARKILIDSKNSFYGYCKDVCSKSKNLYNTANFLQRQVMTGTKKAENELTDNEKEAIEKVKLGIDIINQKRQEKYERKIKEIKENESLTEKEKEDEIKKVKEPKDTEYPSEKKWLIDKFTLISILVNLDDENYRALPTSVAKGTVMNCCNNWSAYIAAIKAYKKNPSAFLGMPEIPKYQRKDEKSAFVSLNPNALRTNEQGKNIVTFPCTTETLQVGMIETDLTVKFATIKPQGRKYEIIVTFDDTYKLNDDNIESNRVMGIDIGVDNMLAITTNIGLTPILVKGTYAKSENQWFNKNNAELQSKLKRTKDNKIIKCAYNTSLENRIANLSKKRENRINDFYHKVAKKVLNYALSNNIDTIVIGKNKFWKQKIRWKNKEDTQNFVQLPFNKFLLMLHYLCDKNGIKYIENEESYTSQASFIDKDFIPVYEEGKDVDYQFSGKRDKKRYTTKDKILLNADVNGSLNIIRKNIPNIDIKYDINTLQHPISWNAKDIFQY